MKKTVIERVFEIIAGDNDRFARLQFEAEKATPHRANSAPSERNLLDEKEGEKESEERELELSFRA